MLHLLTRPDASSPVESLGATNTASFGPAHERLEDCTVLEDWWQYLLTVPHALIKEAPLKFLIILVIWKLWCE